MATLLESLSRKVVCGDDSSSRTPPKARRGLTGAGRASRKGLGGRRVAGGWGRAATTRRR